MADLTPAPTPVPARITAATVAVAQAAGARNTARLKVDTLTAEHAELAARIAVLVEVLKPVTRAAWCADFTEDATGEVATVEIPGEDKLLLVAPGAPKPVAADGVLIAREAQSPEQVFWNAAVLPGWQKFKPTYRRGTITALDTSADTATVTIAGDVSSAQSLGINPTPYLTNVPIKYMTCNAGAFEPGDNVVVKFMGGEWLQPKIVGFSESPRECNAVDLHLVFIQPETPATPLAIVSGFGASGVNACGLMRTGGAYTSIGLSLGTDKFVPGFSLAQPPAGETHQLASFYDGLPVILRTRVTGITTTVTVTAAQYPEGGYDTDTRVVRVTARDQTVTHGSAQVCAGSDQVALTTLTQLLQPPYASVPDSPGAVVSVRSVSTRSGWLQSLDNPLDIPAPSTGKPVGPWASWNAFASDVFNGSSEGDQTNADAPSVVITPMPPPVFTKYSLGAPKKSGGTKPQANLAAMPARVDLATPREYTAAMVPPALPEKPAVTPIDRHLLDFGYLPLRMNSLKIRAVCRDHVYSWTELADTPGYSLSDLQRVNFKTGTTTVLSYPTGASMPENLVFLDQYVVRCENDATGPYFWIWVYGPGMALIKRITNKPGSLGAGFEGVLQIPVPSLPAGSYLIGAMRDELACM